MSENKQNKIAITGATGFVGSHLVRGLLQKGYTNIHALKREKSSLKLLEGVEDKVHWIEGDLMELDKLYDLFSNAEYIIHTAAKVSYNPRDRKEVFKINVEGTQNAVNIALDIQPKKFVFLSSVAAIGRIKSGVIIDENSEWTISPFNTNYSTSKYLAELEVWRGLAEGLKVLILNPSMVIGPAFWGTSSTKLFKHVTDGSNLFPTGENGFVDVRDVVKGIINGMEMPIVNERFILVSENCSYKTLFDKMASALNVKGPNTSIKSWMSSLAWRFYKIKSFLTNSDPAITKETVRITSGKFHYDNRKSMEDLGMDYFSLDQAIKDLVQKYNESVQEKKPYAFYSRIFDQ